MYLESYYMQIVTINFFGPYLGLIKLFCFPALRDETSSSDEDDNQDSYYVKVANILH